MDMNRYLAVLLSLFCVAIVAFGQSGAAGEGVLVGEYALRPEASVSIAHDNRAVGNRNNAQSDMYSEAEVGASLSNPEALLNWSVGGDVGYRFYSDFSEQNDAFYNADVRLQSGGDQALNVYLSGNVSKSLDYQTDYNPDTGEQPAAVLTDSPSRRYSAQAGLGYAVPLSERMTVIPGYSLLHYYQTLGSSGNAEWQTHTVSLKLLRQQTESLNLFLSGDYSLQMTDEEDGYVSILMAGAEGRVTDKTAWSAAVGYGYGDYEVSGDSWGVISELRFSWKATEKVSLYLFEANDFLPGYEGGAARRVYRGGYGVTWQPLPRLGFGASALHDYEEDAGDGGLSSSSADGEVRHFFNVQATWRVNDRFVLGCSGRYNKDELDTAQQVVSLRLGYTY